jgi:hypothetical protein
MSVTELLRCEDLAPRIEWAELDIIHRSLAVVEDHLWEHLHAQDGVSIMTAAGEPRSGVMTFRAVAKLPGVPLEVAADQLCNWTERCKWDPFIVDVETYDVRPGNAREPPSNVFYFGVHAPPFTERDMVTQIVAARSQEANAYYTYCRSVDHPAYAEGRKGRIRAHLSGTIAAVRRDEADPEKSSVLTLITRQDFKLPFVPVWFVNLFCPSRLVDFMRRLRGSSKRRLAAIAAGASLPCKDLFEAPLPEKLRDADAACRSAKVDSGELTGEPSIISSTEFDTDATVDGERSSTLGHRPPSSPKTTQWTSLQPDDQAELVVDLPPEFKPPEPILEEFVGGDAAQKRAGQWWGCWLLA